MNRQEKAEETFAEGYNCCQSVVSAFHEDFGLDAERAYKMVSGFGGGMRRAEVCGAVTGGLMMLGNDRTKPNEQAQIVEQKLTSTICPRAVQAAVRILEDMIC